MFLVNSWKYLRNIQIFTQFPTNPNQTKTGHNQLGKFVFRPTLSIFPFFWFPFQHIYKSLKCLEWHVPSVMALFPSAPAQTLSPRAPPNPSIQRAALTTAPRMTTRKSIDASWRTRTAEAITIPRNTTTLNSNSPWCAAERDLCWDISCACHQRKRECEWEGIISWRWDIVRHVQFIKQHLFIPAMFLYEISVYISSLVVFQDILCMFSFIFPHCF